MSDVMETKCEKALLQRKILWCTAVNNFCGHQRHCRVKGHAVLEETAKRCKYRKNNNP